MTTRVGRSAKRKAKEFDTKRRHGTKRQNRLRENCGQWRRNAGRTLRVWRSEHPRAVSRCVTDRGRQRGISPMTARRSSSAHPEGMRADTSPASHATRSGETARECACELVVIIGGQRCREDEVGPGTQVVASAPILQRRRDCRWPCGRGRSGASARGTRSDDIGNGRITCSEALRHSIAPEHRGRPAYR